VTSCSVLRALLQRDNKKVSQTAIAESPSSIAYIEDRIAPLRARLSTHPLYASIRTPLHLRLFMQSHVFAVWDFMSLLKSLQSRLTCVTSPWVPTALPASRRFINEIVLGEESDEFEGQPTSHFELYLRAMQQAGAETAPVHAFMQQLSTLPVLEAVDLISAAAQPFVRNTFTLIEEGKLHALAAAFTFGREDVIPDMFRAFVRDLNTQSQGDLSIFLWYLERHIEVDGEDHGPLSLRMVSDICGTDERKWQESADAAAQALEARLSLWDAIHQQLS